MALKGQKMILVINEKIQNFQIKSSFALVEILFCVVILSVGLVGVIGSYLVAAKAIDKTQTMFDSVVLLKQQVANIEERAYKEKGLLPESKTSDFSEPYSQYTWISNLTTDKDQLFCDLELQVNNNLNKQRYSLFTSLPIKLELKKQFYEG